MERYNHNKLIFTDLSSDDSTIFMFHHTICTYFNSGWGGKWESGDMMEEKSE